MSDDQPKPDAPPAAADVVANKPDYASLTDSPVGPAAVSLAQLRGVQVRVTAELGRTMLPIGDILELGTGSVIELNRSVNSPVDLMVDDVLVATGEVVVIDDHFAIRIKDVENKDVAAA